MYHSLYLLVLKSYSKQSITTVTTSKKQTATTTTTRPNKYDLLFNLSNSIFHSENGKMAKWACARQLTMQLIKSCHRQPDQPRALCSTCRPVRQGIGPNKRIIWFILQSKIQLKNTPYFETSVKKSVKLKRFVLLI